MTVPYVSVVVPGYNHGRYLARRLQSILNQTFTDFEVLLLDDASTDDSREVARPFLADDRVRPLYNEVNSGSGYRQWDKGVREARGSLVWIAESDDWAEPQLLEQLVMRVQGQVGVAYCQSWRAWGDGSADERVHNAEWTDDLDTGRWRQNFTANGAQECAHYLCLKNTIPNASAVCFRRDLYLHVGGVEANWRLVADWHLWMRMLLNADVAFVADPLNYFRMEPASVTHQAKRDGTNALESYRLALWSAAHLSLTSQTREVLCDKMFYVWTHPQLEGGEWYGWKRNARIYALARALDPRLSKHLARRLLGRTAHRVPGLQRIRRVWRAR